jgi:hypothetical protein
MATSGHKSISRIDSKKAVGWYVRVKFNRKNHTKFFSDSLHGGKSDALEAAIRWRNEKEKELGKPRTDRVVIASFEGNNTGYTGVNRTQKWTGARNKNGDPLPNFSPVYAVSWSPKPGTVRGTSFSINKYGEEEARRKAIELRKRMERKIYGEEIKVNRSKQPRSDQNRSLQSQRTS